MTEILADLFQRLTKEASVTVAGARESVLAISERVNRKTQTMRLHWHAATIRHQMETVYRTLGLMLCDITDTAGSFISTSTGNATDPQVHLRDAAAAVQLLKKELGHVEAAIRDLEIEVLHEDLVKIQRDLLTRSAGISRIAVAPGASAIGLSVAQLNLPATTRVAALFRGPVVLSLTADVPIRAGDILILLGPQSELQMAVSHFIERRRSDATSRMETQRAPL